MNKYKKIHYHKYFLVCLFCVKVVCTLGNQYYFGNVGTTLTDEGFHGNNVDQHFPQGLVAGFIPGYGQPSIFAEGPVQFDAPRTELGKQLARELNIIKNREDYRYMNDNLFAVPNIPVQSPDLFCSIHKKRVKRKKKSESKSKPSSSEKEYSIQSSLLISNREYFLPVPIELGKGVKLNESCLFSPTPIKIPKESSFWKKIEDLKTDHPFEVSSPVTSSRAPFRTSSECLNLFEEAFIAYRKRELLISPEKFVSLARQVGMQLRDSLLNTLYVVSTEDICLAMRMLLFLPHQLRNTVNCKSAIIAALRDSIEVINYELLDQNEENFETKFKDVYVSCKNILKFNEPIIHSSKKQTFKPSEMIKLFRLDLTVKDLQFFRRLSIPHRKAALKVQESYQKYMKNTLLYDVAASVIFLLNEIHTLDQSIEQCSTIVIVCISMQESEHSNLSQDISERICRELGIETVSKKHNVKYGPPIFSQLLKRQTHDRPKLEQESTSYTLPSGEAFLPSSKYGYSNKLRNLEIWPSVGEIFPDGTVSSHTVPACTGLQAFELNRFLFLNTIIGRFLNVFGLGKFKLTVEDICIIARNYLTYKRFLRNESGDKILPDDAIPLAILKVAQKLELEALTISSCREIYREFYEEESSALKKITGSSQQVKLESYYSKPPFSYNSNIILRHTPNAVVDGKMNAPSSWTIFQKNHVCSQLSPYALNRMVLFIAYVLEFWRKNMPSENAPFKDLIGICSGFSGDIANFRPKYTDFKFFSENWLLQKDEKTLHTSILDSLWSGFLVYENSAFPKNTEESDSDYLKRIYHNSLVPEPLFIDDWINIDPPIRVDVAEFIKLLPLVQKPVEILSTLDDLTLNNITLIKAFLESFFEETYQFPVVVPEKDVLMLLERRELEKKPMDDLFFEIMSAKSDWEWIKHETSSHAILKLLEYLKTVNKTVENQIKRTPTKKDIFSSPRAMFVHGKWLIKAPHPVFSPANPLQRRALRGLPKFLLNKARYVLAYFINAFERVLQFELSLHLADIVYSMTNSAGDDKKLIAILTKRLSSHNGQSFITDQVVSEIYTSCMSFSFYRYLLKGALSEEQAFAAPRVFYKSKVGWKFLPPNVPDFSRLMVLSKVFKLDDRNNELYHESDKGLHETSSQKILIKPYTWSSLKGIQEQKKLEIWQLNRAISMCAYFNHWISYKFSKKTTKDIQVSSCINAIYRLKKMNEGLSQSDVPEVFLRYLGIPFLKEGDISEMLSAFTSFEHIDKPNGMGYRQWLINLYRIPQIQETSQNSLSEGFESLRFPIPPEFGKQNASYSHVQTQLPTDPSQGIPEIFVPMDLDSDSLNNFRELLEAFTFRYFDRVGVIVETELEALNFSMADVLDKMTNDRKLSFSDALEQHISDIGGKLSRNMINKLSTAFYKFVLLKFAGNNEESIEYVILRITASRVITDKGKLPFDIPLGIVPGKIDVNLPYNSHSFGEVNFARLVVAYLNEYLIEQFDLRNKVSLDRRRPDKKSLKEFPRFVGEDCVAKSMDIIKKGGVDLLHALDQSCSPELPWINSKMLRMLVSGFMTYCRLNLKGFPNDRGSRSILDFSKENLNSPLVLFDQVFKTWTMQNVKSNQIDENKDKGLYSRFSTLGSVGSVDLITGVLTYSTSSFCSEMNTSQVNRLIVKLQYYRHCISESAIMGLDVDRLLDLNVWCLALRQEMPGMKKTYSNMLFTYFGIQGTIKQSFEILEDAFEILEESWLGENSMVSVKQWAQDFYSSHSKPLVQLNSLIKSGKLFCPIIVTEEELNQFQTIQTKNILNRVEAFQGFSETYLREKHGIIFESKPIIVALLVNSFKHIKVSNFNIKIIKSMVPMVDEEVSSSLIEAFNVFESDLLKGGLSSIEDLYLNPLCKRAEGNWHFYVDLKTINRVDLSINSKLIFSELEVNRIQTIVAFLNVALSTKYPEKLLGSSISFKHIATLFKAGIDLSCLDNFIHYFHGMLQDDLSFSPWLTIRVVKRIFQALIAWENTEIFKTSPTNSKNSGLIASNTDMTKYSNLPVGMIHGKWHWYTWCKRPSFDKLVREVLGDEVVHTLSPQERNLFGIPSVKHKFEIATLFIQYFLQEVLNILVPFNIVVTMEIFKGVSNLPSESVEFLKNLWEHYKNSFIYRGSLPKHDIFHNPIISVVHKQKFFPSAGFPQFDFFDTRSIPASLTKIEGLYGGVSVGSKFGVQRLIAICTFINVSFEFFIRDSEDDAILAPLDLYPIFKDRMNAPLTEVVDQIIKLLTEFYPLYVNNKEKMSHLNSTLLSFGRFEETMLDQGWDLPKLYQKPIVFAIQNGYKMNYNLRSYLPKINKST